MAAARQSNVRVSLGLDSDAAKSNLAAFATEFKSTLRFPLFFVFQPVGIVPPISLHAER